jgi:hypothetical protein
MNDICGVLPYKSDGDSGMNSNASKCGIELNGGVVACRNRVQACRMESEPCRVQKGRQPAHTWTHLLLRQLKSSEYMLKMKELSKTTWCIQPLVVAVVAVFSCVSRRNCWQIEHHENKVKMKQLYCFLYIGMEGITEPTTYQQLHHVAPENNKSIEGTAACKHVDMTDCHMAQCLVLYDAIERKNIWGGIMIFTVFFMFFCWLHSSNMHTIFQISFIPNHVAVNGVSSTVAACTQFHQLNNRRN